MHINSQNLAIVLKNCHQMYMYMYAGTYYTHPTYMYMLIFVQESTIGTPFQTLPVTMPNDNNHAHGKIARESASARERATDR
jgi:hypothetical protein